MTLPSIVTPFEQLVGSAMADGDYKPVWRQFVRTRFLVPLTRPGAGQVVELRVLPNQKDGRPSLLVAEEKDKLGLDAATDAMALSGGEIVMKLPAGVAIGVVLSKGVFSIPPNLVDWLRNSLQKSPALAQAEPRAAQGAVAKAPALAESKKPGASPFPEINAGFPAISLPDEPAPTPKPPAPTAAPAVPKATAASASPAEAASAPILKTMAPVVAVTWDDDLVDANLVATKATPESGAPKAGSAVVRSKASEPLDVQALDPVNVVHAALGLDFYVPRAWQETRKGNTIQFIDPKTKAKIEVSGMLRENISLEKWMEMRLPTVTKEMPFLKQCNDAYEVINPEWRGRVQAMVTEYQGVFHHDNEETHYLIGCYRTDTTLVAVTVRVNSNAFEDKRALYKWLFTQLDIRDAVIAAPGNVPRNAAGVPIYAAGNAQQDEDMTDYVEAPPLFAWNAMGRLGRMRYFAYSLVLWVPFFAILAIILVLPAFIRIVGGLFMIAAMVWMPIRLMVLRLHDLNLAGAWLWLLLVLPGGAVALGSKPLLNLVTLLFWVAMLVISFWPGTKGDNDYGMSCEANPTWVKVVAGGFLLLQVLGILASLNLARHGIE